MGVVGGQGYVVRAVRAEEWEEVKRLRLDALRDPVAHLAFLETYEVAAARPDAFWQERAAQGSGVRQFIAEAPGGEWAGSVTVLLEEAGSEDWAGYAVERRQGHVVGVFVRPEHRGNGLIQELLDAGLAWAWEQGAERVRLFVHADNPRAQGAYLRAGFKPTGLVVSFSKNEDERELEFALDR
ncbi:GNAT family N-acetyltransferase [Streptomyces griseoluteus]|uniref:GNAT family N-acetyltransferase n=1 Tax=Streptomyces griseoluteus TaxID=29306 RepID=UPI001677E885|nr:GNAT family N-acetyltransferase [Streptomyces griseoluteus]